MMVRQTLTVALESVTLFLTHLGRVQRVWAEVLINANENSWIDAYLSPSPFTIFEGNVYFKTIVCHDIYEQL